MVDNDHQSLLYIHHGLYDGHWTAFADIDVANDDHNDYTYQIVVDGDVDIDGGHFDDV